MYIIDDNMNGLFIFLFYQNIGDMDMDFGDAQKESMEVSDAMSLEGTGYSQHNNVEEVISHNKPKKDANLHVIPQGICLYYYRSYFCDLAFCIQLTLLIFLLLSCLTFYEFHRICLYP